MRLLLELEKKQTSLMTKSSLLIKKIFNEIK